jgi:hypothetical protein
MDERIVNVVADLILGDRKSDTESLLSIRCQRDHESMRRRREVTRNPQFRWGVGGGLNPHALTGH